MGYTDTELRRPLVGMPISKRNNPGTFTWTSSLSGQGGSTWREACPSSSAASGVRRDRYESRGHEILSCKPGAHRRFRGSDAKAHAFDALVLVPNCDKIIPECSWLRSLDLPRSLSAAALCWQADTLETWAEDHLISVFEAWGGSFGKMSEQELC